MKYKDTYVQKYGMGDATDIYGWIPIERRSDAYNSKLCSFNRLLTVFYS